MKVTRTPIEGLLIIEPRVFHDSRGYFVERYNQRDFDTAIGHEVRFVQDNHSRSSHGVLRGLHFQRPPHAQGRLVSVVHGAVFDVAVDLRPGSRSFGRWHGVALNGDHPCLVWLPEGLAHGFAVTGESADFVYKTTAPHVPEAERCLRFDDPAVGIGWPTMVTAPVLSARDAAAPLLTELLDELHADARM